MSTSPPQPDAQATDSSPPAAASAPAAPSFREAFFYWLRLGFISFGGPAGQISHHASRNWSRTQALDF